MSNQDKHQDSARSPPEDDAQFVAYYSEIIKLMDRMHQVQHLSLDDDRIKRLRTVMENHLQRLTNISQTVAHAQQKRAALACRFAHQQLSRFADYAPKPPKKEPKRRVRFADTVHSWSAALHLRQDPTAESVIRSATTVQRRMLRVVSETCSAVTNDKPRWYDAPLAVLPSELFPANTAAVDYNSSRYKTSVCSSSHVNPGTIGTVATNTKPSQLT